jgi:P27 family predicted phage terminase small subunit
MKHNEATPKLAKILRAPVELDEHGKKFWKEYAPKLKELRLLSELDLHLLGLAAQWWSIHVRAMNELKESITQISDANGKVARPEIQVAKIAFNAVRGIMQEFGIGPGSRTKVDPLPEEESDDRAARFFGQKPNAKRFLA